ncbi:hypothetical protein [Aliikangiella maris]|uniref:Lipocalin-like domain-containing protein n=1 Tax=Aliikangiella maris TaxID=3162458 RepID=A0ABV2C090_9GAMM
MKIYSAIVLFLLSGCAAVKHSLPTSSVIGSWRYVHNKSGCEEVYTFTTEGTLLTLSGGSLTIDTYSVSKNTNESNRYKVSATGVSVHGVADCSGRTSSDGPNDNYAFYIEFHPNYPNEMIIYYEPLERAGFGPLRRVVTNKSKQ